MNYKEKMQKKRYKAEEKFYFGQLLTQALEQQKMTQKELAQKMNADVRVISRWATGQTMPRKEALAQLEKLLHLEWDFKSENLVTLSDPLYDYLAMEGWENQDYVEEILGQVQTALKKVSGLKESLEKEKDIRYLIEFGVKPELEKAEARLKQHIQLIEDFLRTGKMSKAFLDLQKLEIEEKKKLTGWF